MEIVFKLVNCRDQRSRTTLSRSWRRLNGDAVDANPEQLAGHRDAHELVLHVVRPTFDEASRVIDRALGHVHACPAVHVDDCTIVNADIEVTSKSALRVPKLTSRTKQFVMARSAAGIVKGAPAYRRPQADGLAP